jgi:hypothetical protein
LASGLEVDFILGDIKVAIEAKASARIAADHFKGLREAAKGHPGIRSRIAMCLEDRHRRTEDGIDMLPAAQLARLLWKGALSP